MATAASASMPSDQVEEKSHRQRSSSSKAIDIENIIVVSSIHILCLFAPSTFTWPAFRVAVLLYFITGTGLALGFHRNLSHRSFHLPKWLEYLVAYCGALGVQRDPIYWVSIHRYHHQHADTLKDPHSPIEGFWFSHLGWTFNNEYIVKKIQDRRNVDDLKKQPFYVFLRKTYEGHLLACALLLYAVGGFPFLVWGMGVRPVFLMHSTFIVGSVAHGRGNKVWNTNDLSMNNWWLSLFTFGEGWHNNHHAFEFSARHGLEWWQFDLAWYIIWLLQIMGLATDVKLPTEAQKKKKSISSSDNNK